MSNVKGEREPEVGGLRVQAKDEIPKFKCQKGKSKCQNPNFKLNSSGK